MAATKDQVAQIIVAEAKARGYTRDECLAVKSTLYQESGWSETIWDPTHTTYGIAQQDGSYPNRFDGAAAQIKGFFDRLDAQRRKPGASSDIWLNICWLQQRPNWPSAQYWYDNGRRAYLTEIQSRIATVTPYLDKYWPTTGGEPVADNPNRPAYNAFNNWTKNQSSRGGVAIDCVFIHTNEPAKTVSMDYVNDGALNLSNFIRSTEGGANPVSYHTVASQNLNDKGVTVVYCADTDNKSWSVGNSNPRSLNYCFGGSFAGWTTEQWMQQSGAIDAIAWEIVSDCIKYGLTTKDKRPPVDWSTNYAHNPPVISDHRYCSVKLRDGNNHTDVDNGRGTFPWKHFEDRINEYTDIQLGIVGTPEPEPPAEKKFPDDWTERDLDIETLRQQRGYDLEGWPQLGGRTLVDWAGAVGAKLGIEGCYDTKAPK